MLNYFCDIAVMPSTMVHADYQMNGKISTDGEV